MKVKINEKNENMLLSRIEVSGNIDFSGATPSNNEVKGVVAKELDVDSDLVVIKEIMTQYGNTKATFVAYQYISKDERNRMEPKIVEAEKKAQEDAAKKAEEKKEAPAEEKPAEKKEEPKEEAAEEKKEEAPKGE